MGGFTLAETPPGASLKSCLSQRHLSATLSRCRHSWRQSDPLRLVAAAVCSLPSPLGAKIAGGTLGEPRGDVVFFDAPDVPDDGEAVVVVVAVLVADGSALAAMTVRDLIGVGCG